MAPFNMVRTYNGVKKNRPWKNINHILSEIKDKEEEKPVTIFDALYMKNIEKQKRVKRKAKKHPTVKADECKKIPFVRDEPSLDSTFDRILALPNLQNPTPLEVSNRIDYNNSSTPTSLNKLLPWEHYSDSSSTTCTPTSSSRLLPRRRYFNISSTSDNTSEKSLEGLRKKRQLRSRKQINGHRKRKSKKTENLRLTSTPKCSEHKGNEINSVLSPIVQNCSLKMSNSRDSNIKEYSVKSFKSSPEINCENISSPEKSLNIIPVVDSGNKGNCVNIDCEVNNEKLSDLIRSFKNLSAGRCDELHTGDACENILNGRKILSSSGSEDFHGFIKSDVSNEQSAEKSASCTDSKTGGKISENSLHKLSKPIEDSIILFDSWELANYSKDSNYGKCSEDKLSVQNRKSSRRLSCRRFSHQVVYHQENTRQHSNSPTFRDLYRLSKRKTTVAESIHEEEELSSVEEVGLDLEQSSVRSISVDESCVPFTARDVVLQRCCQSDLIPFSEAFESRYLKNCRKIGEGVYGEVFMSKGEDASVLKIIPIEGEQLVNGEPQKKFDEILSEIVITMELSNLRNGVENQTNSFSQMKRCLCVCGKYPEELIELWDDYNDDKGSENDTPEMFREDQQYIILEMANGGRDLEAYVFTSAEQSLSVFVQTAYALAVAEQALEFEHRDLHWGNVLISPTSEDVATFKLCGEEYTVATNGVQVAIIDFTLSRMLYDGCCIYNDLSRDPELFTAEGDYQFEVYRLMRKHTMDDWNKFVPFTNVLWLNYLIDKMCTMVNYQKKVTKYHKKAMEFLTRVQTIVPEYNSALDLVLSNEIYVI